MNAEVSYQFFRKLEEDTLSFVYQGDFNDDLTCKMVDLGKRDSGSKEVLHQKLTTIITESFQNVIKHREQPAITNATNDKPSMFLVRARDSHYYVASANMIQTSKIEYLKAKIDTLNALSSEELRSIYRGILADGAADEHGSVGLGLLEMARKSKGKLEFEFEHVNYYLALFFMQMKLKYGEEEQNDEIPEIFLQDTKELYALMHAFNIIFTHKGDCSHKSIMPLLEMAELNLQQISEEKNTRKRIFYILIELLQNMSKHGKPVDGLPLGIFLMSIHEGQLVIHTGNIIDNKHTDDLRAYLQFINNLDEEGISQHYKAHLKKSSTRSKGGAGLGLLDIAKYSSDQMSFDFRPFDEDSSFFSLRIAV